MTKINKQIYGMAGDALIEALIAPSLRHPDLWEYRIVSRAGLGPDLMAQGAGYESDYDAVVALLGYAAARDITLNDPLDNPPGPSREQRRVSFTELLQILADSKHPGTSMVRRTFNDNQILRATARHFARVRSGGLAEVARVFSAVGGSLAALATAAFSDLDEITRVTSNRDGRMHHMATEAASKHLWLTPEQAHALFLHQNFSMPFEVRLADGKIGFPEALKVWRHFLSSGEMTWEITAPKEADMMEKLIVNAAEIENDQYSRANGLDEMETSMRAGRLAPLIVKATDYVRASGDAIYDCTVAGETVRVLAESPAGFIRWKTFETE